LFIELQKLVGKKIDIIGKISEIPWQHLIEFSDSHKIIQYFDLESGDQIVVYSQDSIDCQNTVKLSGEVIKVIGKSKRPGNVSDSVFIEYQLLVDDWECFN